jgi:hypothetical protein
VEAKDAPLVDQCGPMKSLVQSSLDRDIGIASDGGLH